MPLQLSLKTNSHFGVTDEKSTFCNKSCSKTCSTDKIQLNNCDTHLDLKLVDSTGDFFNFVTSDPVNTKYTHLLSLLFKPKKLCKVRSNIDSNMPAK